MIALRENQERHGKARRIGSSQRAVICCMRETLAPPVSPCKFFLALTRKPRPFAGMRNEISRQAKRVGYGSPNEPSEAHFPHVRGFLGSGQEIVGAWGVQNGFAHGSGLVAGPVRVCKN